MTQIAGSYDTMYETTRPVYQARIVAGAARREGRAPSHDAEYMTLYWTADDGWILDDNAGVVASDYEPYDVACRDADAAESIIAEAEEIQAEIDEAVTGARQLITGAGGEAREMMLQIGWLKEAQ
jgi:hypothetical protein